ncbi:MAG: DUF378 domain-containing protein [Patescibacteria group bacterium]
MKSLHMVAWILLIVGGLNWLLFAFNGAGVGAWIPMGIMKIVYILVGLSAVLELFTHKGMCKACGIGGVSMGPKM